MTFTVQLIDSADSHQTALDDIRQAVATRIATFKGATLFGTTVDPHLAALFKSRGQLPPYTVAGHTINLLGTQPPTHPRCRSTIQGTRATVTLVDDLVDDKPMTEEQALKARVWYQGLGKEPKV